MSEKNLASVRGMERKQRLLCVVQIRKPQVLEGLRFLVSL